MAVIMSETSPSIESCVLGGWAILPSALFSTKLTKLQFLFSPSLSLSAALSCCGRPPIISLRASKRLNSAATASGGGGVVSTVQWKDCSLRLVPCSEPEIGAGGGGTRWCVESSKSASLTVAAALPPGSFKWEVYRRIHRLVRYGAAELDPRR